jgi:hypothetical protein
LILGFLGATLGSAHATVFPTAAFWKHRVAQLKYTTNAQSTYASICSGTLTVQTVDASNAAVNQSSDLTVTLSAPPGITFYSDYDCTQPVTSVTIKQWYSTQNFYFLATSNGTYSVQASATGYKSVSQTETISTNPFIWTGGGGNANWSTAANWSGGAAPSSSNVALFNGTCSSNCSPTISSSINVGGIRIASDYSGTFTQSSGATITINNAGWVQLAGTFNGSSAGDAFTIGNGGFVVNNATFTSTSGTLSIADNSYMGLNFYVTGSGVFNHHNGSITFTPHVWAGANLSPGATTNYNNVTINTNANGNIQMLTDFNVNGDFTVSEACCGTGFAGNHINIGGNLNMSNQNVGAAGYGSTWFRMVGTNSTITATGTSAGVPNIEIAVSGTVTLVGTINIPGAYKYTSGTVNAGTSTIVFTDGNSGDTGTITPGTTVFNNVTFSPNNNNITISGTFSVGGTLTISYGCCGSMNGGYLDARGNVVISNGWIGGTTQLQMNGTSNATITMSSSGPAGLVTINKTGGAGVTLGSNVSFNAWNQSLTLTSGFINMAGYNLTINNTLTLNGNTLTKNGGTLTVNSTTVGSGSLYGGTVAP